MRAKKNYNFKIIVVYEYVYFCQCGWIKAVDSDSKWGVERLSLVSLQISLSPIVLVLSFTGTATRDTR